MEAALDSRTGTTVAPVTRTLAAPEEDLEEGCAAGQAGIISTMDLTVPRSIKQDVTVCAEHKKPRRLMRVLDKIGKGASQAAKDRDNSDSRVLVFANRIKAVDFIVQFLTRHGVTAAPLSSQLSQAERDSTLRRFKDGGIPVLVATDVAARGVHVDGLRYVVNWDFGTNLEQYVHRVGRVGRQGESGMAFSFFSRALRPLAPSAVDLLMAHGQKVDSYLKELANEVSRDPAVERPGSLSKPNAERDDALHAKGDTEGVGASAGPANNDSDDSESSDVASGSAQRWLANHLTSPITGLVPTFDATSLARWGAKQGDTNEPSKAKKCPTEPAPILRLRKEERKAKKTKKERKRAERARR